MRGKAAVLAVILCDPLCHPRDPPDLSNQVFWLRPDKTKCEGSVEFLRTMGWAFAPCVRADLEPGSEFWAFTLSRL